MSSYQRAILAMGCFWSPDALFGGNPGVIRTQVGYTGGQIKDPVYDDLKDHTEAVQIEFDPSIIRFRARVL